MFESVSGISDLGFYVIIITIVKITTFSTWKIILF